MLMVKAIVLIILGVLAGYAASFCGILALFMSVPLSMALSFLGCLFVKGKTGLITWCLPLLPSIPITATLVFIYPLIYSHSYYNSFIDIIVILFGMMSLLPAIVSRVLTIHAIVTIQRREDRTNNNKTS